MKLVEKWLKEAKPVKVSKDKKEEKKDKPEQKK